MTEKYINRAKDLSITTRWWVVILLSWTLIIILIFVIFNISSEKGTLDINPIVKDLINGVLPNFIAALISSVVTILIFSQRENKQKDTDRDELVTKIASIIPEAQYMSGIVRTHSAPFYPREFQNLAKNAKAIKIMLTWVQDSERVIVALKNALTYGSASVQILHLDPDSPSFEQRTITRGLLLDNAKGYYEELIKVIKNLQTEFPTAKDRIKVRLYNGAPSVYMYLCDDIAFVGLLLYESTVYEIPNIELHKLGDKSLFAVLQKDFDERWEHEWTRKLNFETGSFESNPDKK